MSMVRGSVGVWGAHRNLGGLRWRAGVVPEQDRALRASNPDAKTPMGIRELSTHREMGKCECLERMSPPTQSAIHASMPGPREPH